MKSKSANKGRITVAAVLVALLASPQGCGAFSLPRIPLDAPHTPASYRRHGTSALRSAVDMPMRPMEEEKEKNSTKEEDVDGEQREWKRVVGGFVPKFLKRDGAPETKPAVENVDTLEDYRRAVVEERERLVVVRFFAPWCKSCKAAHPLFKKMVSEHSSSAVKFVEVPLTKETAYIHQGLGVPSVPFGHIYHPSAGLVEEMKINKRVFKDFREALENHVKGSCDLPSDDDEENDEVEVGFQ